MAKKSDKSKKDLGKHYECVWTGSGHGILLHGYSTETVSRPKSRGVTDSYENEWKKTCYADEDGVIMLPSFNIMACMFDGCKGLKKGRHYFTRNFYQAVRLDQISAPFFHPDITEDSGKLRAITVDDIAKNGWLDKRGVVVRGNRVDRIRVNIPAGWKLIFSFRAKGNFFTQEDLELIMDNAGENAGLGDGRPSSPRKPWPYGTFEATVKTG